MPILRVLVEVEYENEIPEGSQQIAADIGAQRMAESVEESGGAPILAARGVIQSGINSESNEGESMPSEGEPQE